jgi:small subunit ribosomal protein S4
MKLFLKGDRCYSDKCAFERRPYPPGQHGQARLKFSEFALQLREKQKTKRYYGLSEKQFARYFSKADSSKEITGFALLKNLELRLDNVVYHLGLANSRREARQLVSHNHVKINGKRVNIPSYLMKKGDVVEVVEASRSSARILSSLESSSKRTVPSWLEIDKAALKGTVKDFPTREDITVPVEENMIVEYYSR